MRQRKVLAEGDWPKDYYEDLEKTKHKYVLETGINPKPAITALHRWLTNFQNNVVSFLKGLNNKLTGGQHDKR